MSESEKGHYVAEHVQGNGGDDGWAAGRHITNCRRRLRCNRLTRGATHGPESADLGQLRLGDLVQYILCRVLRSLPES